MTMPASRKFEEARILEVAKQLEARDPVRQEKRMQDKFLTIAAGDEHSKRQWFVLRTGHKREKDVLKSVHSAGIEAWLPVKTELRSVKFTQRQKRVEVPIFSGYLFVKVVPCAESWVGLSLIEGAISLIFGQSGALVVSDKYMNDLMCLTDGGLFNEGRNVADYKHGERVRFPLGSAGVFDGVIDGYVGTRAVRVLSHIFGQQTPIEVPLANLIKSA